MAGPVLSAVEPLPAASAILVRDDPFEVLLLHRHEKSSFAPGVWVFPGGIAEERDQTIARALGGPGTDGGMRVTAARETFEETGIWLGAPLANAEEQRARLLAGQIEFERLAELAPLDLSSLVATSRWVTPEGLPKRFDTWFFITAVPRTAVATPEQREMVDITWISPREALAGRKSMKLMLPTLRNLESIEGFATSAELIASRRGAVIETMRPVLVDGKPILP